MNMGQLDHNSKYLSLLLRHKPEAGNITLDKNGWALISELVGKAGFKQDDLFKIVETDNKSRYELSDDNKRVRAVQGHSVSVDVELEKCIPPGVLYHGTKKNVFLDIAKKGLLPMNRQHVHLTDNLKTAQETADRRKGESVILVVDSARMSANGIKFYKAKNGVYLVYEVSSQYITEYKKTK